MSSLSTLRDRRGTFLLADAGETDLTRYGGSADPMFDIFVDKS